MAAEGGTGSGIIQLQPAALTPMTSTDGESGGNGPSTPAKATSSTSPVTPGPASPSALASPAGLQGFLSVVQESVLLSELKLAGTNAVQGVYVRGSLSTLYAWDGVIFVRKGAYENGVFKFRVLIPTEYPNTDVPRIFFQSPVYHPKVNDVTGELDTSTYYKKGWRPRRDRLWHLLKLVRHIFYVMDCSSAVNEEAARLFTEDQEQFAAKVGECLGTVGDTMFAQTANCIRFKPWQEGLKAAKAEMLKWDDRKTAETGDTERRSDAPGTPPRPSPRTLLMSPSVEAKRSSAAVARAVQGVAVRLFGNAPQAEVSLKAHVREHCESADTSDVVLTDKLCKGWLAQLNEETSEWQRRWALIDIQAQTFTCYEDSKQQGWRSSIHTSEIYKAFQPNSDEIRASNTFLVVTPTRLEKFQAPSVKAMHVWLHACTAAHDLASQTT